MIVSLLFLPPLQKAKETDDRLGQRVALRFHGNPGQRTHVCLSWAENIFLNIRFSVLFFLKKHSNRQEHHHQHQKQKKKFVFSSPPFCRIKLSIWAQFRSGLHLRAASVKPKKPYYLTGV
jgi:hypothetical protein